MFAMHSQGRLVTAAREYGKGGLLSKFKAALDTSHKKTFKVGPGRRCSSGSSCVWVAAAVQQ
jgi:hypothetical protein